MNTKTCLFLVLYIRLWYEKKHLNLQISIKHLRQWKNYHQSLVMTIIRLIDHLVQELHQSNYFLLVPIINGSLKVYQQNSLLDESIKGSYFGILFIFFTKTSVALFGTISYDRIERILPFHRYCHSW